MIESKKLNDDLLIICSDNMFEFGLVDFLDFFKKRRPAVNLCYDTGDVELIRSRHSCAVINEEGLLNLIRKSMISTAGSLILQDDNLHPVVFGHILFGVVGSDGLGTSPTFIDKPFRPAIFCNVPARTFSPGFSSDSTTACSLPAGLR